MAIEILEPPEGCMEISGFILVVEPGKQWITQDGEITRDFSKRGQWATAEDSEAARIEFCT